MLFTRQLALTLEGQFSHSSSPSPDFPSLRTSSPRPRSAVASAPQPFLRCVLSSKPFRIRISKKYARNSRRIRTSKTQDLRFFRMNTYKKTGEGVPAAPSGTDFSLCSSSSFPCESSVNSAPEFTPSLSGPYLSSPLAAPNTRNTHEHPQAFSPHRFTSQLADTPRAGVQQKKLSFRAREESAFPF